MINFSYNWYMCIAFAIVWFAVGEYTSASVFVAASIIINRMDNM